MIKPIKPIHRDVLRPTLRAECDLAFIVEGNFLEVCQTYGRVHGEDLIPPKSLDGDMLLWRQMRVRHKKGDFRNTEAELKSCKAIADWTVQVKADLCGQKPKKVGWR